MFINQKYTGIILRVINSYHDHNSHLFHNLVRIMEQSQSYNEALGYAQEYAVRNEQNIIDVSSIALGILNTESPFSGIFSPQEKERLTEQLIQKTLEIGTNPLETDAVPLTMNAGLLIKFARQYAMEVGDGVLDVYHVMLALLSYLNETATIFSRSGWIFENYLAQVNKIVSPEINIDRLELGPCAVC